MKKNRKLTLDEIKWSLSGSQRVFLLFAFKYDNIKNIKDRSLNFFRRPLNKVIKILKGSDYTFSIFYGAVVRYEFIFEVDLEQILTESYYDRISLGIKELGKLMTLKEFLEILQRSFEDAVKGWISIEASNNISAIYNYIRKIIMKLMPNEERLLLEAENL